MPQFRQNPLTGQWVIIAPARSKRPKQFKTPSPRPPSATRVKTCPFCPGNEQQTTPEVYAVRDDHTTADRQGWQVRVVPNLYPVVSLDAAGPAANASPLCVALPAGGMHEVVIESPAHDKHFALHDTGQAALIVQTLCHRARMLIQAREVKHLCIFKNHGPTAGTSIEHPHFQIIAPALIPPSTKTMIERQAAYAQANGRPLFGALLQDELACGKRIIATNDAFVALAPWASQLPYETWIIPREHRPTFGDLPDNHLDLFATTLRDSLFRLHKLLDNPDYHLIIHTSPKWQQGQTTHRWFTQITPRLITPAAFEFATGVYINETPPEEAAAALRNV